MRRWTARRWLVLAAGTAVVTLGVAAFLATRSAPAHAATGDCVHQSASDQIVKTACGSGQADLQVLRRFSGTDDNLCDTVAGTDVAYVESDDDAVLCMRRLKH